MPFCAQQEPDRKEMRFSYTKMKPLRRQLGLQARSKRLQIMPQNTVQTLALPRDALVQHARVHFKDAVVSPRVLGASMDPKHGVQGTRCINTQVKNA